MLIYDEHLFLNKYIYIHFSREFIITQMNVEEAREVIRQDEIRQQNEHIKKYTERAQQLADDIGGRLCYVADYDEVYKYMNSRQDEDFKRSFDKMNMIQIEVRKKILMFSFNYYHSYNYSVYSRWFLLPLDWKTTIESLNRHHPTIPVEFYLTPSDSDFLMSIYDNQTHFNKDELQKIREFFDSETTHPFIVNRKEVIKFEYSIE